MTELTQAPTALRPPWTRMRRRAPETRAPTQAPTTPGAPPFPVGRHRARGRTPPAASRAAMMVPSSSAVLGTSTAGARASSRRAMTASTARRETFAVSRRILRWPRLSFPIVCRRARVTFMDSSFATPTRNARAGPVSNRLVLRSATVWCRLATSSRRAPRRCSYSTNPPVRRASDRSWPPLLPIPFSGRGTSERA